MPFVKHPSKAEYDRLSDPDDTLSGHVLQSTRNNRIQSDKLVIGLGAITVLLFSAVFVLIYQGIGGPSQLQCAQLNSPYSPIWEAVEFWEGDFDNEFPHKTLYRGPPTPERDQAWRDLWLHPPIFVPDHGIAALNKTGRTWIQSDDGKGYFALLEVFHQLHCLDVVRQYTWRHLYSEKDVPVDIADPVAGRMHVDHCIETLRLSLMCYADITPLLAYVDDDSPLGRRADFNVHHKCRDFHHLVDYLETTSPANLTTSNPTYIHENIPR